MAVFKLYVTLTLTQIPKLLWYKRSVLGLNWTTNNTKTFSHKANFTVLNELLFLCYTSHHITIFKKRKIYFADCRFSYFHFFFLFYTKFEFVKEKTIVTITFSIIMNEMEVCSVTWIVSAIHQLKSSPSAFFFFFKSGRSAERIANRQLILMIEFKPSLYSVSHSFSQRELSHPYWLEMNYLNYSLLVFHQIWPFSYFWTQTLNNYVTLRDK